MQAGNVSCEGGLLKQICKKRYMLYVFKVSFDSAGP